MGVHASNPLPEPGDTLRVYQLGGRVLLVTRSDGSILHDGAQKVLAELLAFAEALAERDAILVDPKALALRLAAIGLGVARSYVGRSFVWLSKLRPLVVQTPSQA